MKTIHFNELNEILYTKTLKNGLKVYLLPKTGFNKTYVTISTPLGSNVTTYTSNNEEVTIPDGVAHFLEHKLFDKDGFDISEEFALQDAQVNAYTMNTRTTYLFHCTNHLDKNIKTLMNLVFNPKFTKEGIKKEIGIIEQEIKMYEDDPNTAIYMGTLRNMYESHPVRNDILGTVESISTITKELLEDVHSVFYNPNNMIMFVTGNFVPEDVIQVIEQASPKKTSSELILPITIESTDTITKEETRELEVMIPNTLLGIKLQPTNYIEEHIIKKELTYSILLDMLLGKSSDNFQNLLRKELVNDTFGLDITLEESYGYLLFGGNTNHPVDFFTEITNILQNANDDDLDPVHFHRTKRQIIGGFISALNSLEYIANQFTKYYYQNASLFDILEIAKEITLDDVKKELDTLKDKESYTRFTVYPKNNQ